MNSAFVNNPLFPQYVELVLIFSLIFGISFFFRNPFWLRKLSGIILVFLPIIYFYLLLLTHTINVPYSDDYNLLETIINLKKATGWYDTLKILLEQVNQHRFGFERIVMLFQLWITGTINIKWLIVTGNLFMFGIAYLFYKTLRLERISWYYFIPVPYILFSLVYSENAFWGIAAIQNTPVIFWAFVSVFCLSQSNRVWWYIGAVIAIITTFTSGNGMLTWVIGAAFLIFRKEFKFLVLWLFAAGAVLSFYFLFEYQVVQASSGNVLKNPLLNVLLFFGFLGNSLYLDIPHPLVSGFYVDMVMCAVLGMVICFIVLIWFVRFISSRKLKWTDWFLLGVMMFLMGTGAMFVISRPSPDYFMLGGDIFSRRYMIFGVVFLTTIYVCLLILAKTGIVISRVAAVGTFIAVVCLNFVSYFTTIVAVRKLHDELSLDGYFWTNYSAFLTQGNKFSDVPFWNHPSRMKNLMADIDRSGISKAFIPDELKNRDLIIPDNKNKNMFDGKLDIDITYQSGGYNIAVKFLKFQIKPNNQVNLKYMILKGRERIVILPAIPVPYDWPEIFLQNSYYSKDYKYEIFRRKLPVDDYEIWVMTKPDEGNSFRSLFTGKVISLK